MRAGATFDNTRKTASNNPGAPDLTNKFRNGGGGRGSSRGSKMESRGAL